MIDRERDESAIRQTLTNEADETMVSRPRAARRLSRAQTIYLIALALFAMLAACAYVYPYFTFDIAATRFVQSIPGALPLMRIISIPGNSFIPHVLTALTVSLFLIVNRRSEAAGLLLSAGGSGILNVVLKNLIARPRPTRDLVEVFINIGSSSFPSGHVTFYVTYFGFLFFAAYAILLRGAWQRTLALIACALPVLLVGFSRIYLGAHWLSDTLGAYMIGGVWLGFSLAMYRRWKERATLHKL